MNEKEKLFKLKRTQLNRILQNYDTSKDPSTFKNKRELVKYLLTLGLDFSELTENANDIMSVRNVKENDYNMQLGVAEIASKIMSIVTKETDNNMRLGVANDLCSQNINIVQLSLLCVILFTMWIIFIITLFVTTNTCCKYK